MEIDGHSLIASSSTVSFSSEVLEFPFGFGGLTIPCLLNLLMEPDVVED